MCHYKPRIWKTPVPGNEAMERGHVGRRAACSRPLDSPTACPPSWNHLETARDEARLVDIQVKGPRREPQTRHFSTCALHVLPPWSSHMCRQAPRPPQVPSSGISDTKAVITDRSTAAWAGRGWALPDGPRRGLALAAGVRGAPRDDEKSPSLS